MYGPAALTYIISFKLGLSAIIVGIRKINDIRITNNKERIFLIKFHLR
jgi:hypothetical protein